MTTRTRRTGPPLRKCAQLRLRTKDKSSTDVVRSASLAHVFTQTIFPSEFHGDLVSAVVDGLTFGDLAVAYDGRAERLGAFAGRVGAFALADLQRGRGVVPGERDVGVFALLIGVGLVVVLMQGERGVPAGVDADFHRSGCLLRGVLGILAVERDDAAGLDEERELVHRAGAADGRAAVDELVGEEVVPLGADREVDVDRRVVVVRGILPQLVRGPPAELEFTRVEVLVVVETELDLLSFLQLDVGGFVAGVGGIPVLDDQLAVEPEAESVIAGDADLVLAVLGGGDEAGEAGGEVVAVAESFGPFHEGRSGPGEVDDLFRGGADLVAEAFVVEVFDLHAGLAGGRGERGGVDDRGPRTRGLAQRTRDRLDEHGRAEHKLGFIRGGAGGVWEVHDDRAGYGVVVLRSHPGEAVDVGHHTVAELRAGEVGIVRFGGAVLEAPRLLAETRAVPAVDRVEDRELVPAGEQFQVFGVVVVPETAGEESAGVLRPVGQAGERGGEAADDVFLEAVPAGGGVAGPGECGVTLLSCPGGTREREDALVGGGALAFIAALRGQERVAVQVSREVAHGVDAVFLDVADHGALVMAGGTRLDLGAVHPGGVDSDVEEALLEVFEVDVAAFLAVGVVHAALADPVRRVEQEVLRFKLAPHVAVQSDGRPDGDHDLRVEVVVDGVAHGFRIGVAVRVPGHAGPVAGLVGPVLPVLHDEVERVVVLAERFDNADHFLLRTVAFLAHEEAVRLAREHRGVACEFTILRDDAVEVVAGHEVVIDAGGRALRPDGHAVRIVLENGLRADVPQDAVVVGRGEHVRVGGDVRLDDKDFLAAVVQIGADRLAEAVDRLVRLEREGLLDLIRRGIGDCDLLDLRTDARLLREDDLAVRTGERQRSGALLDFDRDGRRGERGGVGSVLLELEIRLDGLRDDGDARVLRVGNAVQVRGHAERLPLVAVDLDVLREVSGLDLKPGVGGLVLERVGGGHCSRSEYGERTQERGRVHADKSGHRHMLFVAECHTESCSFHGKMT